MTSTGGTAIVRDGEAAWGIGVSQKAHQLVGARAVKNLASNLVRMAIYGADPSGRHIGHCGSDGTVGSVCRVRARIA